MPPCRMTVERIARAVEIDIVGQLHRQVRLRHRHHAASLAMDHRDRAAPVALARNAPIAQAEIHLALGHRPVADRLLLQQFGDFVESLIRLHAVEKARIDHHAVIDIGFIDDLERRRILAFRHHHRNHRQAIFVGEVEVALVAGRAAENGAGAVFHQHEIGDIDRQRPVVVKRMDDAEAGVKTLLLSCLQRRHRGAHMADILDELRQCRIVRSGLLGQRMIGGDSHEGSAEDGVGPCRIDFQLMLAIRGVGQRPTDQQAFRAADPVLLHQLHFFRPFVEAFERIQQILGEVGDPEEPLRQFALFDQRARAPAAPVDDLLVGKHRHVLRIPVDLGGFAHHQPLLDKVEEQHLLAVVVIDVAGGEFARPVQRQPHDLELLAHGGDVLVGPLLGVDLILHRRVFGRMPKASQPIGCSTLKPLARL